MRALILLLSLGLLGSTARADRIKDLCDVEGVRGNALTGLGVVVGLAGTGDDLASIQTKRPLAAVLRHLGSTIDINDIRARNVALVLVTATLPPFARPGTRIDVTVSSSGTARSLQGGTLISTALKGPDKQVYALAQGPIAVGGFSLDGANGSNARRNHPTVGRIPSGGTIERDAPGESPGDEVTLLLRDPDFTTATRIAAVIDKTLGEGSASVRDPGAVVVEAPEKWKGKAVQMIAELEALEAEPDVQARVVLDERTGTVVVGGNVRLNSAAVAHGGMTVRVTERQEVSQPNAFATGSTTQTTTSQVEVDEMVGNLTTLKKSPTVADVAAALNALGVRPRDLLAILQALRAAGALRAELVVL